MTLKMYGVRGGLGTVNFNIPNKNINKQTFNELLTFIKFNLGI